MPKKIRKEATLAERKRLMEEAVVHDSLMDENYVAQLTGLSLSSIRRYRTLGTGPVFIKLGSAVRYRKSDVAKWIEAFPTGGGAK